MPHNPSTNGPRRLSRGAALLARGRRPATGRSFVIIVVVASVAALGVALWTLHSLAEARPGRDAPAGFHM